MIGVTIETGTVDGTGAVDTISTPPSFLVLGIPGKAKGVG